MIITASDICRHAIAKAIWRAKHTTYIPIMTIGGVIYKGIYLYYDILEGKQFFFHNHKLKEIKHVR